jgi:glycerol uptake facilitator-like aquaporin
VADLARRLAAEGIGTAVLVAAVVGSGIMAQGLSTDGAVVLLCNALATGAVLVVLITVLAPVSGAHLNPIVSLVLALRREFSFRDAGLYVIAQIAGGIGGVVAAHAMFDLPLVSISEHVRSGTGQWISEAIAGGGLVAVVIGGQRANPRGVPWLVGLYIIAAYWFTASTSFANPAVTIARALTDSFAGIRPADVPAFVLAQAAGALAATAITGWLLVPPRPPTDR